MLTALIFALLYGIVQFGGTWVLYLAANQHPGRQHQRLTHDLTIDVLVTAYDEEVGLIERCLKAARDMSGEHQTWLLDDARRPELHALAQCLGTGYLTRKDNLHHKAGNLNAALNRTTGDIVVIFDIDHVPQVDFLDRTMGYFNDPLIGFVQVMLTFVYKGDNATSKAASESSLDFYNPASRGADAVGSATLVGSNALVRRTALDSIGGYQPGLAEDLATSIAIHAAGWRSVYVKEPLAPGLAPPDLKSWFDQQFKWSRGVFELLITKYPAYWPYLTSGQKLSYAVRMTYYWIGLIVPFHILITIIVLFWSTEEAMIGFGNYLLHLLPIGLVAFAIRGVALRHHASVSVKAFLNTPVYLQWKPFLLVIGTWPVYTASWFLTLFRVPTSFRPTPKKATGQGPSLLWIVPQIASSMLLLLGIFIRVTDVTVALQWLVLIFAIILVLSQTWILFLALRETIVMSRREPENRVANGI